MTLDKVSNILTGREVQAKTWFLTLSFKTRVFLINGSLPWHGIATGFGSYFKLGIPANFSGNIFATFIF